METYRIAGLPVAYNAYLEPLITRSEKYKVSGVTPIAEFTVKRRDMIDLMQRSDDSVDWGMCEYMLMGAAFYEELILHGGMMLHASAVVLDGEAYLFSAPCGTGKSTHTALWLDVFGKDRAFILNDDKPAIRFDGDTPLAYGTPFSGKYDINVNTCAPIKGICFLEQAKENTIAPMEQSRAIHQLLNQTKRPAAAEKKVLLLQCIGKILETIPIYQMGCNISAEAVQLSYQAMKNGSVTA